MSLTWRRALLWLLPTLLLAGALAYAFRPVPVPVDMGTVSRGPMQVTVGDEGRTRVRDVYLVSAPIDGLLLRVESEVGDPVTAYETILASIQPTDPSFLDRRSRAQAEAEVQAAEAAMSLADAEVKRAMAELEFARADLERAKPLAAKGTISKRELERAELELKTRDAALETARAALKVRRSELATARALLIEPGEETANGQACCVLVRAPVSGRVLQVLRESQGVVRAGAPLLEVGDPKDLEVVVDLLSSDAVKIEPGAPAMIEEWGGGATLNALVRRIEPSGFTKISALGIEEQRVNVILDFNEPPERLAPLGHGYRIEARIVIWDAADVLKIPMSALFRAGNEWAVFVDRDGRAVQRIVKIGKLNTLEAQVLDGLAEGERVVLYPSDRVEEEARITRR